MSASRRRAFTLVELLVVIALLSMLMAFLLPALRRAVETARIVSCTSNQKQLYLGSQNYSTENGGFVILHQYYKRNTSSWQGNWQDYLPKHDDVFQDLKRGGVFVCPTWPPQSKDCSYGRNQFIGDGYYVLRAGTGNINSWKKIYNYKKPDKVFEFACHKSGRVTYWYDGDKLAIRHRQDTVSVLLFFDGHLENLTYSQVYDSPGWWPWK